MATTSACKRKMRRCYRRSSSHLLILSAVTFVYYLSTSNFQNENLMSLDTLNLNYVTNVNNTDESAPNTVHFALLLKDPNREMLYFEYLAIKAAKIYGKADEIILHYDKILPTGNWFHSAKKYLTECRQTKYDLSSIFGHKIDMVEHKKDVLQLLTLHDTGGFFMDLDTIILKPVQDLLKNDFTLVKEGRPDTYVCSFMQAKATSLFLKKWIEAYTTFNDGKVLHLCQKVPAELLKEYPGHSSVLEKEAAVMPWYNTEGHRSNFFDRTYNFDKNYATHLWHFLGGKPFSEAMNTELIWSLETSLFCKLRNLTADEDGAGEWTEEMSKDCETINIDGAPNRVKGLIGYWPLSNVQTTMPKVLDISGNRMHGILSPLNRYTVAGTEFNESYYIFKNGDHIYLPMLPECKASSFTLTVQLNLGFTNGSLSKGQSTLLSIVLSNRLEINAYLEPSVVVLRLQRVDQVVGYEPRIVLPEISKWFELTIIGNQGKFILALANQIVETETIPMKAEDIRLAAVWLGRKNPKLIYKFNRNTDVSDGCYMANVKIYDHARLIDKSLNI